MGAKNPRLTGVGVLPGLKSFDALGAKYRSGWGGGVKGLLEPGMYFAYYS